MSDFLLDLILYSLSLYWVGLGPPIFVKVEVAANFELPNRHFATGRVWVMGSSKQVTFSINSSCQVSFWDLCIKALTFTSCLRQSCPPSSLGLFQYLQHLIFLLPYLLNVANVWWFLLQWQVLNCNWKLNISYMMQLCSLCRGLVVPCMQITPSL